MTQGGAQSAGQRVGGQLRGVQLARAEAAELGRDLLRSDPGRVEQLTAARQRHRGTPGRNGGAAAAGVEPGIDHPLTFDAHRELDLVAAGEASDGGAGRARGAAAMALRRGQVMLEGDGVHRPRG